MPKATRPDIRTSVYKTISTILSFFTEMQCDFIRQYFNSTNS